MTATLLGISGVAAGRALDWTSLVDEAHRLLVQPNEDHRLGSKGLEVDVIEEYIHKTGPCFDIETLLILSLPASANLVFS